LLRATLVFLDHAPTRFAVETERFALDALGGGCQLPVGVHVVPPDASAGDTQALDHYRIYAQVVAPDGEAMIQLDQVEPASREPSPFGLGERIAADLASRGARDLLGAAALA
jgi:hydroxymethylbilane synthase